MVETTNESTRGGPPACIASGERCGVADVVRGRGRQLAGNDALFGSVILLVSTHRLLLAGPVDTLTKEINLVGPFSINTFTFVGPISMKEPTNGRVHACFKIQKDVVRGGYRLVLCWRWYFFCLRRLCAPRSYHERRAFSAARARRCACAQLHTDIQLYGTAEFQNAARACSADRR